MVRGVISRKLLLLIFLSQSPAGRHSVQAGLVEIKNGFPFLVESQTRFKGRPFAAFKAADHVGFSIAYQGLYLLLCQLFTRHGFPYDKITAFAEAITAESFAPLDDVTLVAFGAAELGEVCLLVRRRGRCCFCRRHGIGFRWGRAL